MCAKRVRQRGSLSTKLPSFGRTCLSNGQGSAIFVIRWVSDNKYNRIDLPGKRPLLKWLRS